MEKYRERWNNTRGHLIQTEIQNRKKKKETSSYVDKELQRNVRCSQGEQLR